MTKISRRLPDVSPPLRAWVSGSTTYHRNEGRPQSCQAPETPFLATRSSYGEYSLAPLVPFTPAKKEERDHPGEKREGGTAHDSRFGMIVDNV
jgi:hypothetical protein